MKCLVPYFAFQTLFNKVSSLLTFTLTQGGQSIHDHVSILRREFLKVQGGDLCQRRTYPLRTFPDSGINFSPKGRGDRGQERMRIGIAGKR
jgi:hypothetical protein